MGATPRFPVLLDKRTSGPDKTNLSNGGRQRTLLRSPHRRQVDQRVPPSTLFAGIRAAERGEKEVRMGSELNQGSRAGKPYILEVVLDRKSSQPLHAQISKPLEKLILSGELEASALIEDEVSMAKRLSVSRPTTRRALQDLVAKGLLSRQRGIGTHVTPRQVHRPMGLTSLKSDLERLGFKTETEVLSYEVFLAGPEEEQMFRCDKGTELVRIEGNSLIAAGDEDLVKIHFHTNEPWKVLEYCSTVGEIYDIVVEDMIRQSAGLQG